MKDAVIIFLAIIIIAVAIIILTQNIPLQQGDSTQCVEIGNVCIEFDQAFCRKTKLTLRYVHVNGVYHEELVAPLTCDGMIWAIENGAGCEDETQLGDRR